MRKYLTAGSRIVYAAKYLYVSLFPITERVLLWKFQNFPFYHYNGSINQEISMGQWYNDIDRRTPKYTQKNLSQCHYFQHKFQAIDLGSIAGFCG
jgi:hypothetical protein